MGMRHWRNFLYSVLESYAYKASPILPAEKKKRFVASEELRTDPAYSILRGLLVKALVVFISNVCGRWPECENFVATAPTPVRETL